MNISKQQPAKTTVELTVEMNVEDLKPYLDKAVERISKEVKIDGFRPGKAPYEMIAKKIGEMEIYQEAAREAVDGTLPNIVKEENIEFVGQPQVGIDKVVPGDGITYKVTFALMPAITLKEYKSVHVPKEEVKMDEAKLERTLTDLRKIHVKITTVEREAKEGDQVQADFDVTLAGVAIEGGQGRGVSIGIGDKQFIPGFEEQLVGMKAGDTKKFMLTFPADYGASHLAGKECEFTVTVKSVGESELPELNDEFAAMVGFKTAAELEEQIRNNIQRELEAEYGQKYETQVIDAMLEQAEFDPIPEPMIENELSQMMHEMQDYVQDQGGKFEEYLQHLGKTPEELKETWKEQAEKRVKAALLMKEIATVEDITVSEADIDAEVARVKEMYNDHPEQLAQLDGFEFRAYTRSMLRNKLVMDKLMEYAATK